MGDGDPFLQDDAPEMKVSSGERRRLPRRRPPPRASERRDDLSGEHVPLGTGWVDEMGDDLGPVPLSTAWAGTMRPARLSLPLSSRRLRLPRLRVGFGPLAGLGAVALIAAAVFATGLPTTPGASDAPRRSEPTAASASTITIDPIADDGPGLVAEIRAQINQAAALGRRGAAQERRRRERVRVARRRAAEAEAAAAARARSAPAPPRSQPAAPPAAPTPVADPWPGVSPMERQTTPGPWNNGGAT